MPAIPASAIVQVKPGVISAGGTGLDLSGLVLTANTQVPIGTVLTLNSAAAVSSYFGPSSTEAALAAIYFGGFDNSSIKPGALLFSQYPTAAVAGYLRGGSVASLTLTQLQALSGVLTVVVNGVSKTSSSISLAAATSFSNAATIIAAAFTSLGATVTFDSVSGAFVFTSSTTGAASTLSFATGTLSAGLKLTAATGAVVSAGAIAAVPATALDAVVAQTQNFASFTTTFEPDTANKVAFATWTNGQGNRFLYAMWDTDASVTLPNPTTSAGYQIQQSELSGTALIYSPDWTLAAFVMGAVAAIDFTRDNDRSTLAFRSQSGIAPNVTDRTIATQLEANGYNYYGAWATANDQFQFLYPGSVSGPFAWIDSYVNQIWMNNGFQLALMTLLTTVRNVPYTADGYALIEAAAQDPINAAVDFGAIRAGVTLSQLQAAQVNAAAGRDIASTLEQRGWYFLVQDPSPAVRTARGSPPCTFWYTDGQSVQRLNLSSLEIQ